MREAVREVLAEYVMEDATMALCVTLPEDYPLSQAKVESERAVVTVEKRRRWLLQLTVFLSHQVRPLDSPLSNCICRMDR